MKIQTRYEGIPQYKLSEYEPFFAEESERLIKQKMEQSLIELITSLVPIEKQVASWSTRDKDIYSIEFDILTKKQMTTLKYLLNTVKNNQLSKSEVNNLISTIQLLLEQ